MSLSNLTLVCALSFIISSIGIMSLSARIVGIRTRKIATSASIFNLIALIGQFANTIRS